MTARLAMSISAVLLALAAPASAQVAQRPQDVTRIEAAVVELAKLKKGSAGQVSARQRVAESAMGACRTGGPGWARVRKVRDASQRNAYARGARTL